MRNKKLLVSLGLVLCMTAGSVMGVLADDTKDVDDNYITFKTIDDEDLEDEKPGDPKDPDEELEDPEEPKVINPSDQGHLAFVSLPGFDFGTYEVGADDEERDASNGRVFYAKGSRNGSAGDEVRPYFVQVRDIRGNGAGFTVTAEMTKAFTSTTNANHKLESAYINLSNTKTIGADGVDAPSMFADRKLEKDSLAYIASADDEEGMGTSYITFGDIADASTYDNSVKLTVPINEKIFAEKYQATIEWKLTSGPTPGQF